MPFYDRINTIYQFIKLFLDKNVYFLEGYETFKACILILKKTIFTTSAESSANPISVLLQETKNTTTTNITAFSILRGQF